MTFFGEYRGDPERRTTVTHQSGADAHATCATGHGGFMNPRVMLAAGDLWRCCQSLAVDRSSWVAGRPLSFANFSVGRFVGYGGHFEHFLAPVFQAGQAAARSTERPESASKTLEYSLMGVSVAVAFLGWFLAWLFIAGGPKFPHESRRAWASL